VYVEFTHAAALAEVELEGLSTSVIWHSDDAVQLKGSADSASVRDVRCDNLPLHWHPSPILEACIHR